MTCYTVSKCILDNKEKKYLADILFTFTHESNPFKVALDKSNKILDLYESTAQTNDVITTWLELMSRNPTSFEKINVETHDAKNEEEVFLKVCAATKSQQKLFVSSHQGWQYFNYTAPNTNIIHYNDTPIQVFDRDEAVIELNQRNASTIHAYNSVIATGGSTIQKVNNTTETNNE